MFMFQWFSCLSYEYEHNVSFSRQLPRSWRVSRFFSFIYLEKSAMGLIPVLVLIAVLISILVLVLIQVPVLVLIPVLVLVLVRVLVLILVLILALALVLALLQYLHWN